MEEYEKKLKKYIQDNNILAEHLSFSKSCHSVKEAAEVAKTDPQNFVKNICLLDSEKNLIVAIVKGEDNVSTSRIAKILNISRPIMCTPEYILKKTGYPCGGTPSFGYNAQFLIDPKVMEKEVIYSGGGSENSLLKISPSELQKANQGKIVRIRK
ncbi:YbaK/EbsC family protein [bacterium]|nr:YbaK/EbsC family protein [bacterium]